MRLLVLCPHYEPDVAPTGEVMTGIVSELARRGHEIRVVTSLPWYRKHRVEPEWRGRPVRRGRSRGGVGVTRVHPFPTSKSSVAARAAGFAGFTMLAASAAAVSRARPDAVLAMSPPVTLGLAGWVAARRWRVPLVFNLQDIFPDAAIDTGAIRGRRLIAAARRLERFVYERTAAITVLSEDMRANVAAKLGAGRSEAVRVIPNFADTARIRPRSRLTAYRTEHGLADRTVVMYAGNVGFSQPLDLLLGAARSYRHRDDVVFVVNGEGSARRALEESAAGLPNMVFVGYQPAERLDEVLASADIHVVVLGAGLARSSVPSKIYSILAAGRPVVASVDPQTELPRLITEAGCGAAVAPGDQPAFDAAIDALLEDPGGREAMGRRGRAYVEGCMTPQAVGEAYEALFTDLRRR